MCCSHRLAAAHWHVRAMVVGVEGLSPRQLRWKSRKDQIGLGFELPTAFL